MMHVWIKITMMILYQNNLIEIKKLRNKFNLNKMMKFMVQYLETVIDKLKMMILKWVKMKLTFLTKDHKDSSTNKIRMENSNKIQVMKKVNLNKKEDLEEHKILIIIIGNWELDKIKS